jgi:hypothetical protein
MTTTDTRELDAIIHEFLTGEEVPCMHATVSTVAGSLVRCDGCGEEFGAMTLAMARNAWPRYSTDIAVAWGLLETLAERWPGLQVHHHVNGWFVLWGKDGHGWQGVPERTAPLAICGAGLAQKLADDKQAGDEGEPCKTT